MVQEQATEQIAARWRNEIVRYDPRADLRTLKPSPENPKTHPNAQLDALEGLINEVGIVAPLIVNERTMQVLDGHARLEKGLARGETHGPVAYVNVSDARARLILATFDPIGALAQTDKAKMAELLANAEVEEKKLVAFLATLRPAPFVPTETPVPPVPEIPVTQPGDMWRLGPHRILCADATTSDAVFELFNGAPSGPFGSTLITSPPYWRHQPYDNKPGREQVAEWMHRFAHAWSSVITRRINIQTGHTSSAQIGDDGPHEEILLDSMWQAAFRECGWLLRHRRAWVKSGDATVGGWSPLADMVADNWEVILTLYRAGHNEGGQERMYGEPWETAGVWEIQPANPGAAGLEHPCPFPEEIPARIIRLYSKPGEVIIDPFLGAGTTLIAAHRLGRVCFGTEINPAYCDVAVKWWENMSGEKAHRLATATGPRANRIRPADRDDSDTRAGDRQRAEPGAANMVRRTRRSTRRNGHVESSTNQPEITFENPDPCAQTRFTLPRKASPPHQT